MTSNKELLEKLDKNIENQLILDQRLNTILNNQQEFIDKVEASFIMTKNTKAVVDVVRKTQIDDSPHFRKILDSLQIDHKGLLRKREDKKLPEWIPAPLKQPSQTEKPTPPPPKETAWRPSKKNPNILWCPAKEATTSDVNKAENLNNRNYWYLDNQLGRSIFTRRK